MRTRFALLVFGSLAIVAGALGQSNTSNIRGRDWIHKSIERTYVVRMSAIVVQTMLDKTGSQGQFKVEQDGEGRRRLTVLHPLSMQGTTTWDDGKVWTTLYPDEDKLVQQESPRLKMWGAKARSELIEKNYVCSVETGPEIAGRRTVRVVAVPKAKELTTRRYCFDKETAVLLRLETSSGDSDRKLISDTKAITFDPEFSKDRFKPASVVGTRLVKIATPDALGNPAKAKDKVGFVPVLPSTIPLGFVVTDARVLNDPEFRGVMIRMTDGLAAGTMYQISADEDKEKSGDWGGLQREMGGIKFRFVGELPVLGQMRIMEAFLREASLGTNNRSAWEPNEASRLLQRLTQDLDVH